MVVAWYWSNISVQGNILTILDGQITSFQQGRYVSWLCWNMVINVINEEGNSNTPKLV